MARNQQLELVILETSDLHGYLFPKLYANHAPAEIGLAKVATLIHEQRAQHEHVLYIDNGDLIQGSPLAYYYARLDNGGMHPMVRALNELGCDAAVIGNHEFNYGMDLLTKAVNDSAFPWLSANIKDQSTGEAAFETPYLIREFPGGVKVGILGLTTPYIPYWESPDHIQGLVFEDAVECAKRGVDHLRNVEKVDMVIVSYHGGFERDLETGEPTEPLTGENQGYALCQEVEGIDVLLTGHQHRQLAGTDVNGVCVLQPGTQGAMLGKVTVVLERLQDAVASSNDGSCGWHVVSKYSELLQVNGKEASQSIMSGAERLEADAQQWLDQPIGRIEGDMLIQNAGDARLREHPFIEFVNRVQMDVSGADISSTSLFDNTSAGFPSDVTMRDIVSNYIYPNTLKVLRLTGADIRSALERTASYFETYYGDGEIRVSPEFSQPKPQHYNYDMWEGIEYTINISKAHGKRVESLTYKGEPVHPEREYDVVMNNYRAGGGGNYFMFVGKPAVRDIPTDVSELIATYIMDRGSVKASVNNNFRVIWDEKPQ